MSKGRQITPICLFLGSHAIVESQLVHINAAYIERDTFGQAVGMHDVHLFVQKWQKQSWERS